MCVRIYTCDIFLEKKLNLEMFLIKNLHICFFLSVIENLNKRSLNVTATPLKVFSVALLDGIKWSAAVGSLDRGTGPSGK